MTLSVLALAHRPWIGRRNTDIRYIRSITGVSSVGDVEVNVPSSLTLDAIAAVKTVALRIRHESGIDFGYPTDFLSRSEIRALQRQPKWDVLYTNSAVPRSGISKPVIRFDYLEDTQRAHSSGDFARNARIKLQVAQYCRLIQVSTRSQADTFVGIGVPATKIHVVPFYLPNLVNGSPELLLKHRQRQSLRVLFVGHQARRKGLDALLRALSSSKLERLPIELTVVSKLLDWKGSIPRPRGVTYHPTLPNPDVMQLMREAHVLAVPSRRETFGLVYVEAMAAGAIPIMSDGPQQEEIARGGCGFPVGPDPAAIADSLYTLYENPELRLSVAESGFEKVKTTYAPTIVAEQYREMFRLV
ncbi:MAG: glycosyltransferase family 4 protein [Myxococcota bacterium]